MCAALIVMIVVVCGVKAYSPAFTATHPQNLLFPGQCKGTSFSNVTRENGNGYDPETG